MLETIQTIINNELKNTIPFNLFFESYVMDVQDSMIDQEISYMLSHNIISVSLLDRAISEACRGLSDCDM